MITKKVFHDLAIYMIGFGIIIGVAFPWFVVAMGIDAEKVLTPLFFILCISAGIAVGSVNIVFARKIVGKKLKTLSKHMKTIEKKLEERSIHTDVNECAYDQCMIDMKSEDEIGQCANSFNALIRALIHAMQSEEAVRDFTIMLSSYLELEPLAREALTMLIGNLNVQAGSILLEDSGELEVLFSFGIRDAASLIQNDYVWKAVKTEERVTVNIPEDIMLSGVLTDFRPKTVVIEPIVYKEAVLGVCILGTAETLDYKFVEDIKLYVRGLALAFRNAITHEQLQRLAAHDALTGIFNRRFGMMRLHDEFIRANKQNTPLGLILFDIDHFKAVNDTYGHPLGDKVLKELVITAQQGLREGDVFIRYGGEEFLIVLPGASTNDVFKMAEMIRHMVEDSVVAHRTQRIKITISLGGVSYPSYAANDIQGLIDAVDKKLYQAKEEGRNRTVMETS